MGLEKVTAAIRTTIGDYGSGEGVYSSLPKLPPLFRKNTNVSSPNQEARTPEQRTSSAVSKANEANNNRMIAEINRSAEIDSPYSMLLTSYAAYNNHELSDFTKASDDTVYASYKRKSAEIRFSTSEDEKEHQNVIFEDGSQICYTTFLKDGKMEFNGEEFDIPAGTVVETKNADGRMFSQLVQLPDMKRRFVEIPEYIKEAEQTLRA